MKKMPSAFSASWAHASRPTLVMARDAGLAAQKRGWGAGSPRGASGPSQPRSRAWPSLCCTAQAGRGFFIFIFFKTVFTEIYFWFHILQFYTPTAQQGAAGGLPPGRGAAGTYM